MTKKAILNKKTFVTGMNKLLVTFPGWGFDIDNKFAIKTWYEFFEHMDDERFLYMIDQYIENESKFPTVAGLKKCDTIPRKSRTQIEHEQMLRENGLL
mgnify:FL=1